MNRLPAPAGTWKWPLRLLSLLLFASAWELVARRVGSLLFPSFTETVAALGRLIITPSLWEALWISNQAMVVGFALAAAVGIPLGFIMGRHRTAGDFFDPYLSILLVTPMSALMPIIIMATGLGLVSRVLIVFSFAFVVVVVNARTGVQTIDASWIDMARAFGATERQLWTKIFLRGSLPALLTGLRLGVIRSVAGMIIVELLLIALGIGRLIIDFQGDFDSANVFATVFVVVFEAVALAQIFRRLERRASPWMGQVAIE